jgi:hypothetical protein
MNNGFEEGTETKMRSEEKAPTAEEIAAEIDIFNGLVEIMPEPRRGLVKGMMDGPVGQAYFVAPASSRVEYHSCYPGGLLVHSLNVTKNLKRLVKALCPGKYDDATLAFVGLFHDLGKAGDGVEEFYVPNPSDWHRQKGMLYETNKRCVYMPTSERGLYILQKHGIQVSPDEYLAIRLNDGMYTDENKGYRMKEPGLALLVHWADRWSAELEKNG